MKHYVPIAALFTASALISGCMNADYDANANKNEDGDKTSSVNGSISVKAGQKADDVSTVNGSIHIDNEATITDAETVNGNISVGERVIANSLQTVNGSISLDDGSKVTEDVSTVNGALTLEKGADVGGKVANVNGAIRLTAAHVAGGIQTTGGDIEVGQDSKVEGGIHVERESMGGFRFGKSKVPRIVIGPGAVVDGALRFERKVELYVSETAKIGPVEGATPVKFSGNSPPG
jgi:hypothetical protein